MNRLVAKGLEALRNPKTLLLLIALYCATLLVLLLFGFPSVLHTQPLCIVWALGEDLSKVV
jgi:hypothetical protein